MGLIELIVVFLIQLLFWIWVVRWGGARRLEGTFTSGFLINIFAPRWTEDGIKLFAYCSIVITTILFLLAIYIPDLRYIF